LKSVYIKIQRQRQDLRTDIAELTFCLVIIYINALYLSLNYL